MCVVFSPLQLNWVGAEGEVEGGGGGEGEGEGDQGAKQIRTVFCGNVMNIRARARNKWRKRGRVTISVIGKG